MSKTLAQKPRPNHTAREELKHEIDLVRKDVELVKQELKYEVELVRNSINWLKWFIIIGLPALLVILLGLITYLHNDTKDNMKEMKTEMKAEMKELRSEINKTRIDIAEINKKLEMLLRSRR